MLCQPPLVINPCFVQFIMLFSLHNIPISEQMAEKSPIFPDLSAYFGDFHLLCKPKCVIYPQKPLFIMLVGLHNIKTGG